ncbi:glycosyltransferase family 4 protein [Persicitalea jodogahamensis]|uniref:Glycosyltransferase n=1 Tax=Persicitalea jodogahamensis TaxID=402147 RepID=A0A8J3GAQ3_9BACT|nr:glycosyltransferase family 4 protein [Persicitalea jodogahamensis]GHB75757.1 hypothetical protein GCM10007390_31980 [Persicitalea jodogahamensis]
MRVLIIHNQAWAHYKSVLFQEINQEFSKNYPDSELLVAHIALHERSRAVMTDDEKVTYGYPQVVLFRRSLDSVTFSERLRALFKIFRKFKPDVLNINGWFDPAQIVLALYAKKLGVKLVISSESSALDRPRKNIKESLKTRFLRQSDAFFCFGKTSVDYLKSLGIDEEVIPVKKAAVVDNSLISNVFSEAEQSTSRQKERRRNFIYVGRLAKEKNLSLLLAAYRQCQDSSTASDWGLIFVGDGPLKEQLVDEAATAGLATVHFTGGMPWHKVPAQLALADILVLPSLSEPWGLVVNEAMVCGMPVIASRNCGCVDDLVHDGQNGFIFDPTDKHELADAMRHYISHPGDVAQHGTRSRELIAPFSPESVAREMAASFHKLIQQPA